MGVNSLPKTVTRQCRGCDLNPSPTAPESSTLPSHVSIYSALFARRQHAVPALRVDLDGLGELESFAGGEEEVDLLSERAGEHWVVSARHRSYRPFIGTVARARHGLR